MTAGNVVALPSAASVPVRQASERAVRAYRRVNPWPGDGPELVFERALHRAHVARDMLALAGSIDRAAQALAGAERAAAARTDRRWAFANWQDAVDRLAAAPADRPDQLRQKVEAIGRGFLAMGVDARQREWRNAVEADAAWLGVASPIG